MHGLLMFVCFVVSYCSKVKTLDDELHVATNSLKALEISDEKVCFTYLKQQLSRLGQGWACASLNRLIHWLIL